MIRTRSSPSGFFMVMAMVMSLLVGTLVSACSDNQVPDTDRLNVQDLHLRIHPGGARIITGRLVNLSSDPVTVAQIKITLFDADNLPISRMSVVLHNILPGDGVLFREPVDSDEDIRGARVKNILVL